MELTDKDINMLVRLVQASLRRQERRVYERKPGYVGPTIQELKLRHMRELIEKLEEARLAS